MPLFVKYLMRIAIPWNRMWKTIAKWENPTDFSNKPASLRGTFF